MNGLELLRKLHEGLSDAGWGSTILYWAIRHLEVAGTGQDIRYGQCGSVENWLKENEFWDGKEELD